MQKAICQLEQHDLPLILGRVSISNEAVEYMDAITVSKQFISLYLLNIFIVRTNGVDQPENI